jgi:hypothetical protein
MKPSATGTRTIVQELSEARAPAIKTTKTTKTGVSEINFWILEIIQKPHSHTNQNANTTMVFRTNMAGT